MASSNFNAPSPLIFTEENFPIWSVKMKAYLRAFDLWEVVDTGSEPPKLRTNPTTAQINQHNEKVAERYKALSCIHLVLKLLREFEVLKMNNEETIKGYFDKVLKEQRRALRHEDHVEEALTARTRDKRNSSNSSKKFDGENKEKEKKNVDKRQRKQKPQFPPCSYCKKRNQTEKFCCYRPTVRCRSCHQQGHVEKECKNKGSRGKEKVIVVEEREIAEEVLFMMRKPDCSIKKGVWLIDSACSNHMTDNDNQFISLNKSYKSTIEIGNGDLLQICRSGTVGVKTESEDLVMLTIKSLKFMASAGLVNDLPLLSESEEMRDTCLHGKQNRLPFPKQSLSRAFKRLQIVHTDVGGPVQTPSMNGSKYFILCIDDFSR
ncbi:uncharacterized protein LOC110426593 [Herrania umbratica]|uniref:Uncharacterized protein LOC110426593 n=1 Tax=Herrania umbratica TaxID=108875 RepID=A0A6J1BDW9_9ROSI|nr:uncharacterized protein LOC110426593 [Herrania umbratica]